MKEKDYWHCCFCMKRCDEERGERGYWIDQETFEKKKEAKGKKRKENTRSTYDTYDPRIYLCGREEMR